MQLLGRLSVLQTEAPGVLLEETAMIDNITLMPIRRESKLRLRLAESDASKLRTRLRMLEQTLQRCGRGCACWKRRWMNCAIASRCSASGCTARAGPLDPPQNA